ncbi:MAG: biotin/lipoyl-binding protein [Phycisphaerales bacterium]|nr:biotin/lipoyl-binding protein [Phycisphaerales bacterium]
MKKVWILLIALGVLIGGGFALSKSGLISMSNIWLDGQKEEAIRGDLVIPVTAIGIVEPARLIQIKSKAGGEVRAIHVVEGQQVQAGQILMELDPVDEKRNVEASQAAMDRAESALEKAKIALDKQKKDLPYLTAAAEGRVQDTKARLTDSDYRLKRLNNMPQGVRGDQELVSAQAARDSAEAAVKIAEADLAQAKNNEVVLVKSAEQDVVQAEAAYREAQKRLDEAKQRFAETKIVARSDGMVYSILAREGEMIQSGTSTFTGGTLLMVLADASSMFVMAEIDEADIGEIREIAPKHARPGQTEKLDEAEYIARMKKIIEQAEKEDTAEAKRKKEEALEKIAEEVFDKEGVEMKGRPVKVTVESYRGEEFRGVIERILPEPQRASNAVVFKVRIRLMGDDLTKLMGQQADLEFQTETMEDVVLVKNEALTSEGKLCFVYVPHRESSTERWGEKKVQVKIGKTDGTYTEVIEGVDSGQEVWVKRPRFTEKEKRKNET